MIPAPLATVLVGLAGAGLLSQATDGGQALTAETARRIEVERTRPAITPLAVETMNGTDIALPRDGRISLVEFIYTTCPTICQAAGPDMRRLADTLAAAGLAGNVSLYSISFDPGKDTVERLKDYGDRHGADGRSWTIARPRPADLDRLLNELGVIVILDRFGGFVHNIAVHVVSADGRLTGIFDPGDFDGILANVQGDTK